MIRIIKTFGGLAKSYTNRLYPHISSVRVEIVNIILRIAIVIFSVEAIIMLALPGITRIAGISESLLNWLDAGLLTIIAAPLS